VVRGEVPVDVRRNMELWVGCIAGALEETEYKEKLSAAGFASVEVEPTRIYQVEEAREFLVAAGLDAEVVGPQIKDKFMSAFIRAAKPAVESCCGPTCGK
jgi:arsenite methyltransferase